MITQEDWDGYLEDIDSAQSKSELKEILFDIKEDIIAATNDDEEGGRQYTLH